ncbi:MAG: hypothetical protein J1E80_08050 [Desulfovibrionaceae bacterium]|nr:hypothetical protein [Desulfovibrionaceae bacterium]
MAGHTLFLDPDTWDLTLDAGGGIATTSESYGIAQNVANAVRLFTKDAFYNPDRGLPHFLMELGVAPDLSVVRGRIRRAAMSVDGVADASVDITGITNRVMEGKISLTTDAGETVDVEF